MKMHLTHNENIKILEDYMRHFELEKDRLMANKTSTDVYMASSNSHGGKWRKLKFHGGNKQESKKKKCSSKEKTKVQPTWKRKE